jgi:tetratricopeptide (TPR) repeat protein
MAFEKAKVLKAAEKFLSQGKISAAIKEYRQIVDNDVADLTTLNMLGDLYVRTGKSEEAVSCFERIAEHYATQEFNLKAIAMYKKIERLKPRDPAIAFKLAELYASQALVVDARANYLIVADAYSRAGQNKKALDILHKVADLEPNNTDIRLKLAEGYLKEGMRREAAGAFVQAANRLHKAAANEKALVAYGKALEIEPEDVDALRGMLEAHIDSGTADEAAEVLERIVEGRESETELVAMLARAYLESEDPRGAERAIAMLMTQDASNYIQFIGVARLYLKAGEANEAIRILASIIERMLAGREEKDLLELVNQVLESDPDHVAALRMLVRIHWWQRDMDALRSSLERLVEAAEASELVDEERYALTQLVRLAPDEQRYLDRLNLLGGLQEETRDEFAGASDLSANEVPEFENFAVISNEPVKAETAGVVETTSVVENDEFETNAADPPAVSDPASSFADLNDTGGDAAIHFESSGGDFQEVDFGDSTAAANVVASSGGPEQDRERTEAMMKQELESIDFYITQGYSDIAMDTLAMLEKQFGSHPEITARRETLTGTAPAPPAVDAVFEFGDAEELLAERAEDGAAIGSEIAFASIADDGVGSADPLSSAEPPAGAGLDAGLAELFEEFRLAEEEDVGIQGDYETHYNMGTAYKEMDLVDEAIQEYQTAAGLAKPNDGTSRFLQCCNMLGHCFMQKGMPRAAIIWFKKGLDAPGQSDDEYQALRYELGAAYEQLGDNDSALKVYTEVYGADVSYREVGEKLRKLGERKHKKKNK